MNNHTSTPKSADVLLCDFAPLDTWFFRESRPHGSVGSSELGSVFPPPVRTLLGALRTLIGDAWHAQHGTNWRDFANNKDLQAIIGYGDDLGSLRVTGPFITLNGQRLYPAPANLMVKEEGGKTHYFLLDLGQPVHCDLGKVHLPCFPEKVADLETLAGSKPAEKCWLTQEGFQAVVQGKAPGAAQVVGQKQLFQEEPRLGIGRDNSRKSVQEGLLYQTRHLRLFPGVSVQLELHGLPDASLLPTQTMVRLGGEGRQAALSVGKADTAAALPKVSLPNTQRPFVLYNLTPVLCAADRPAGIPAGFNRPKNSQVWEGELGGIRLRILSVACGRPLREGGWDLAQHAARPVQSLLAPGSVLYVQAIETGSSPALQTFTQLADASGRGLYVAGQLPESSTFQG